MCMYGLWTMEVRLDWGEREQSRDSKGGRDGGVFNWIVNDCAVICCAAE